MRILLVQLKDGRMGLNWTLTAMAAFLVHVAVIGSSELLWWVVSGGVSPLLAGFGLVVSILLVVRMVAETLYNERLKFGMQSETS